MRLEVYLEGAAPERLEDRTLWVGDLHKLSSSREDAKLVPLLVKYFRRFGPLDSSGNQSNGTGVKVRQSNGTGGQGRDYAFVVFEHVCSAEAGPAG